MEAESKSYKWTLNKQIPLSSFEFYMSMFFNVFGLMIPALTFENIAEHQFVES